jgi:AcrR family transcriptional regulator
MDPADSTVRQRLLEVGLKLFAARGYAGTSVQHIVDAAGVTKPALYYYFKNKAGLYSELIRRAQDDRMALMQAAAGNGGKVEERLASLLESLLQFARERRDDTRLCYAGAIAAPEDVPNKAETIRRARRNYEFVHNLIREAQASGELDSRQNSRTLASVILGQWAYYALAQAADPDHDKGLGNARELTRLFLHGAAGKGSKVELRASEGAQL